MAREGGAAGGPASRGSLREVAWVFLKIGVLGFGGPAAHIALQRDEVVARRRWLSEQDFLDLVGAVNFIPGPNSTELAIHLGYRRAGWRGLVTAGVCFITPAMLLVLALAWLYERYGTTPSGAALMYGVKPVVIAVVAVAVWQLGRTAAKGPPHLALSVAAFGLGLWGVSELALLAGGAAVMGVAGNRERLGRWLRRCGLHALAAPAFLAASPAPVPLEWLFWQFLKFGSVVFGSGYVLLAFLKGDLVERLGWLSEQQLLDAVAAGQVTPGPVFTTATFIGYLLGGLPGAAVATLGIFLPSFLLVAATGPLVPRLRQAGWAGPLLDGVNATAVGIMAAVTVALGRAALVDPLTVALALAALAALLGKVNAAGVVAAGALVGLGRQLLG